MSLAIAACIGIGLGGIACFVVAVVLYLRRAGRPWDEASPKHAEAVDRRALLEGHDLTLLPRRPCGRVVVLRPAVQGVDECLRRAQKHRRRGGEVALGGNGLWVARPDVGRPFYPLVPPDGMRIVDPGTPQARLEPILPPTGPAPNHTADVLNRRCARELRVYGDTSAVEWGLPEPMGPPLPPSLRPITAHAPAVLHPVGWRKDRNREVGDA